MLRKHIPSTSNQDFTQQDPTLEQRHLYVLASACRALRKALAENPGRRLEWLEWEWYLSLLEDHSDMQERDWSWLSMESPLAACAGMAEGKWVLERLRGELEGQVIRGSVVAT
jgi:hypothetical protein